MVSTWKWIRLVLFLTASAILVHVFVIDTFRVKSDSMLPTLWPGDYVLAYRLARQPRLGDIVLLARPNSPELFTKRVVGLEGDIIALHHGRLIRNGETAQYQPADSLHFPADGDILWEKSREMGPYIVRLTRDIKDFGPIQVPSGHFFVLGDNRAGSIDSREWGSVPVSAMKGRLWSLLFSVDQNGSLRKERSAVPL